MTSSTRVQAIVLAAITLIGSQAAGAVATKCVSCNETQMYNAARAFGPGTVTVWNPVNGEAHRYTTYCGQINAVDPNARQGNNSKSAGPFINAACKPMTTDEVYLPSEVTSVAQALSQIYNATASSMSISANVPVTTQSFPTYLPAGPSAHNFLTDIQLQHQLAQFASSPTVFTQGNWMSNTVLPLQYLAGHIDAMMGFTEGVQFDITFQFHDGSTVRFHCVVGQMAAYVPMSAEDSSGHLLPDQNMNQYYPGQWYYGPGQGGDMEAFVAYLQSLGIPVTSGTGRPGGIITCIYNPTSHETICVRYD